MRHYFVDDWGSQFMTLWQAVNWKSPFHAIAESFEDDLVLFLNVKRAGASSPMGETLQMC